MTAVEIAIRTVVDLLVRGEFDTLEKMTRGRRLSATEISAAVSHYGRTLVAPGAGWWSLVEITPITGDQVAFHAAVPLWTKEEGRSDLSLELRLAEFAPGLFDTEVLDVHVL